MNKKECLYEYEIKQLRNSWKNLKATFLTVVFIFVYIGLVWTYIHIDQGHTVLHDTLIGGMTIIGVFSLWFLTCESFGCFEED